MMESDSNVQDALREGRAVSFLPPTADGLESDSTRARHSIPASWLEALVNDTGSIEQPILIEHAIIEGPLSLVHVNAERSIAITDSKFTGPVDWSFAEFSHGIRLDRTHFVDVVSFRGMHVSGDFSIQGSRFDREVVLDDLHVGMVLDASGETVFSEGVRARRITVDKEASFVDAIFGAEAVFNNGHINVAAHFGGTRFRGLANFNEFQVTGSVYFGLPEGPSATFEGRVDFRDARLGASTFIGVEFGDDVDFGRAIIGGDCYFVPDDKGTAVRFAKGAYFTSAQITGNAFFTSAQFQGPASFDATRIGGQAHFTDAQFADEASFGFSHITGMVLFVGAQFQGPVTFLRAVLEGDCLFNPTEAGPAPDDEPVPVRFAQGVNFGSVQITGDAHFHSAVFEGPASFDSCLFGGLAAFRQAQFGNEASFASFHVTGKVYFLQARFGGHVTFRSAQFARDVEFQEVHVGNGADLRDMVYQRLDIAQNGGWRALLERLEPYDRQPYTHLESMLRQAGVDRAADDVYYARRDREFKIRLRRRTLRDLAWVSGDFLYRLTAGYGVKPLFFVLWTLFFLVVGTWAFRQPDAVVYVSAERQNALAGQPLALDGLRPFWVSLDQLLPITIPGGSGFVPSDKVWETKIWSLQFDSFATILTILGWVLIPAGIGIVSAALRRQV